MKYPRTPHLCFSLGCTDDDKRLNTEQTIRNFINTNIIITEKLDGGNTCLNQGKVYARSHNGVANHESFDYLKRKYSGFYPGDNIYIYGENMYALHSIKYTNLTDYFYVFGILDNNEWLSWDELTKKCLEFGFNHAPIVYRGTFNYLTDLEDFMNYKLKEKSYLSDCTPEGFVIRNYESFKFKDFYENVAKFVRKNHVQTDMHWSRKWKKQELANNYIY